jgi:hypothetical protein
MVEQVEIVGFKLGDGAAMGGYAAGGGGFEGAAAPRYRGALPPYAVQGMMSPEEIKKATLATEEYNEARKRLFHTTTRLTEADRQYNRGVLIMNMSILGLSFSTMMFARSMSQLFGLTVEQTKQLNQYTAALYIVASAMQLVMSIESLLTIVRKRHFEWTFAQKLAEANWLAPVLAATIIGSILIGLASIKFAQTGAWIPATPGGQLVMVGEGGQGEIISPIPMMKKTMMEVLMESGGGMRGTIIVNALDGDSVIDVLTNANLIAKNRGF